MGLIENYIKDHETRLRSLENRTNSAVTGEVRMQNEGGESQYNGAFVTGSVEWDKTTGQPTSGTGGLFNEAGLFAVKNGVNTIKQDFLTGDAYFKGDITGASGNFSGKIVAGGMSIGNDVNGTLDGIYIDSNDYWYSNGNFSMGNGSVLWNGSILNVNGIINASGGVFTGYVQGGNMLFGANVSGSNDGIYIDSNDYWFDNGTFSLGNGGLTYNGSTLEVIGKVFSQVSGRKIGLEGEKINFYDTGGIANGYIEFDSSDVLTLFSNRKVVIESTGSGDDIELKAGDALRFYYNGAGTSSDMEFYSKGDRKIKINQDGLINTEGGFGVRIGVVDYNGVSGTFTDNNGNVVRVRMGIITDLDE